MNVWNLGNIWFGGGKEEMSVFVYIGVKDNCLFDDVGRGKSYKFLLGDFVEYWLNLECLVII